MNTYPVRIVAVLILLSISIDVVVADNKHKTSVTIQKAIVDADNSMLAITGRGFDNGRYTRVWLADQRLEVLSADSDEIAVALPTNVDPGDYLLTVRTGRGSRRTDQFDLTIPPATGQSGQIIGYYTVYDDPQQIEIVPPGQYGAARSTCAPGDYAVSASFIVSEATEVYSPDFKFRIHAFSSGIDQTSPTKNQFWSLSGWNESAVPVDAEIHVRVTCADVAE